MSDQEKIEEFLDLAIDQELEAIDDREDCSWFELLTEAGFAREKGKPGCLVDVNGRSWKISVEPWFGV